MYSERRLLNYTITLFWNAIDYINTIKFKYKMVFSTGYVGTTVIFSIWSDIASDSNITCLIYASDTDVIN